MTDLRALAGNLAVGVLLLAAALALAAWQAQPWAWTAPAPARLAAAIVLVACYAGAVVLAVHRRRARRTAAVATDVMPVVHASQTGFALQLAERTAEALTRAGLPARPLAIADLDAATLAEHPRLLFIAATTGEGDAPDTAAAFLQRVMAAAPSLAPLQYGLLALGDRSYAEFCAFGRQLDHWLQQQGATPLFDRIDVDDGDPGALRHWQHHLRQLTGGEMADWEAPAYAAWTLRARRLLNPGSAGGPCFHLELAPPPGAMPQWEAGDIAEIGPRDPADPQAPPLPHREYSIASLPADGAVHLLVRLQRHPDGRPGAGSGWLCDYAPIGGRIDLRLRSNPGFHPPADDRPLLLIGNGTGLAGLRALLKARVAAGHRRNWLLFGERHAAHDAFHGDELEVWRSQGWIERLDRVWSRDLGGPRYVQDRLRECAPELRAWVEDGAAVYVCGSLTGMAPGVDATLRGILGDAEIAAMLAEGRYRRDVY
ncbi:sulfite reductase subunit alpha [Arenimonas composti]|uniref:NADPH--hemoprotein reductase n=1 Tax=Arenimonas composti TR7-09 = DSM 18010 TaxID=1121013 RepID=A0A091BYV2_9GAMM|nr:sulfite reductase subunit alpha [Arenimonas composti]KFN49540.1 hypothetical protein P873_10325 [Arenimonas composti TR7-09 = DSM 18010]